MAGAGESSTCVAFNDLIKSYLIRPSFNFSARATLPVGAGLGSSASFSACAATALLLLYSRIQLPTQPAPTDEHIHASHQGRRAIPPALAEEVNRWAFVSEKILHGNPSGVDNSVAVFGGALSYTRAGFGRNPGMVPIQGFVPVRFFFFVSFLTFLLFSFKSLKFLLTDSRVPRNTKQLVAGVAALKEQEPEFVEGLLNAIQHVSDEAQRALADPKLSREALLATLSVRFLRFFSRYPRKI